MLLPRRNYWRQTDILAVIKYLFSCLGVKKRHCLTKSCVSWRLHYDSRENLFLIGREKTPFQCLIFLVDNSQEILNEVHLFSLEVLRIYVWWYGSLGALQLGRYIPLSYTHLTVDPLEGGFLILGAFYMSWEMLQLS